MKIVLIGAGSSSFGRGQIVDVLRTPDLHRRGLTLSLVDIDPHSLRLMARFAEVVRDHLDADVRLERTTDRGEVLPGADYVLVAVSRRRYPLWEQDFRVPLAHGLRHCLGENGGPGAVFHALRSYELVLPICADVERLCPDALMLNFTNPEARVLHAICHLTKVRAIGICHGVSMGVDFIAKLMGRKPDELEVTAAGVNHFYAVLKVLDRATGKDILPQCKQRALESAPGRGWRLFRKMLEVFDVFTFPSDDHIGEYLSFGSEYSGVKWPYGQESRKVGREQAQPWLVGEQELRAYAEGTKPVDERALRPSGEHSVPIIADIALDRRTRHPSVNVLNADALIENVPRTGIVEVPAVVDGAGVHPERVGLLPEPFAAFLRTQYAIHDTLTEAYRTKSRKLLLQALLLDPVVNNISAAERMLDEMLELQSEFLPEFT